MGHTIVLSCECRRAQVRWDTTAFFFASAWPTLFLPTHVTAEDGTVYNDIGMDWQRIQKRDQQPSLPECVE